MTELVINDRREYIMKKDFILPFKPTGTEPNAKNLLFFKSQFI
jgi:hypothetical protein